MKKRSIRRMLFSMLGGLLGGMLLFYFVAAYSNYRTIQKLNEITEEQLYYDSYEERLDILQDSVTAYFNQSEEIEKEELLTYCKEFENYVYRLTENFSHPQFLDNKYIVQEYLDTVRTFLGETGITENAKYFEHYNRSMELYRMVKESYGTTAAFAREIIIERLQDNSRSWREKENLLCMSGILVCILAFFWGRKFVNDISKPLIALTECSKQIGKRKIEEMAFFKTEETICRETAVLSEAFQNMAITIQKQMEELKEKMEVSQRVHQLEMENVQTKMNLMQSLISPHFLFNCLGTLTSLAFIEGAAKTEECSIQLAQFFRVFLDRIGKTVTIKEEVEHTFQYIEIQKLRFGKRVSFNMKCVSECENRKIPALILQPLVENALIHGMKNMKAGGKIDIFIYQGMKKETVIEVRDNGEGIAKEIGKELEQNMEKTFDTKKGIGLRSVCWRLDYFFGKPISFHLFPLGPGTCVEIRLP